MDIIRLVFNRLNQGKNISTVKTEDRFPLPPLQTLWFINKDLFLFYLFLFYNDGDNKLPIVYWCFAFVTRDRSTVLSPRG